MYIGKCTKYMDPKGPPLPNPHHRIQHSEFRRSDLGDSTLRCAESRDSTDSFWRIEIPRVSTVGGQVGESWEWGWLKETRRELMQKYI